MLRNTLGQLERGAFRPETLPPDVVMAIAVAPPVLAGLLLFHLIALEMLALAIGVGAAAHLAVRYSGMPLRISPVLPAVIGVGLVGPGAPQPWIAAVAVLAAALELARARLVPAARIHTGLLAYAALFLASGGALAGYLNPGSLRPLGEPIALWHQYGAASAFDGVRLYVGNVPGPVFATSLLAVGIGAAWLWYARRLSLVVVASFLGGALAIAAARHWNLGFQLDSGPTWFAIAFLLADRQLLPGYGPARPVAGVVAGSAALGLRGLGYGVEGVFLAAAGVQVALAMGAGIAWLAVNRAAALAAARRFWRSARGIEVHRKAA